jgi:BirA family biotin operon repressor/biotin-[acetyl-CoA-carboxylase] ligase
VNQSSFPEALRSIGTSLLVASGSEWSRVELLAALLKSLHREYRDLLEQPGARESILRRFSEGSTYVRGKRVRIEDAASAAGRTDSFEGVTEGLDARGFLQVRTKDGIRTVLSGTVRAA